MAESIAPASSGPGRQRIEDSVGWLDCEGAGSGPSILFIHSVIADSRMWNREMNRYTARFRVGRFDLRGFGRSAPARAPYSCLDDVGKVIEQLHLDRPILVGSSMGGAMAIDYALEHPSQVRGLFLGAPGLSGGLPPPYTPEEKVAFEYDDARSTEINEAWTRGERPAAIDGLRRLWCSALEGANRALFLTMVEENLPEVFDNRSLKVAFDHPPAAPRLHALRVPTTILVGDRDNPSSVPFARRMEGSIPGARLVTVPGADHLINLSMPDAFDRELETFLARTPA
jgi:3-oxoadipate enol-lactonase